MRVLVLLAFCAFALGNPAFMLDRARSCSACRSVVAAAHKTSLPVSAALCDHVVAWSRALCLETVSQHGEKMRFMIAQGMETEALCAHLGACESAVVPAEVAAVTVAPKPLGAVTCAMCKDVVGWVEKQLNATNGNVTRVLLHVCDPLPSVIKAVCESFINAYGEYLVPLIEGHYPPAVACQKAALCDSNATVASASSVAAASHAQGLFTCEICKDACGIAEKYITSNDTITEIVQFLQQACNIVPASFRDVCNTFIAEFATNLAPLLQKDLPCPVACADVGACSNSTKLAPLAAVPAPAVVAHAQGLLSCEICEDVCGFAEKYITSNDTVTQVVQFLQKACNFVPAGFRDVCNTFISDFATNLAPLLQKDLPCPVACADVGACSNSTKPVPVATVAAVPAPLLKAMGAIECLACRLVVNAGEEELSNSNNEAALEQFLNKTVCSTVVPSILRPECDAFVTQYLPVVVAKLLLGHNASVVCLDLHMCPSSSSSLPVARPAFRPISIVQMDKPLAANSDKKQH